MKNIFTIILCLFIQVILWSNVAQPGIRNAGGNGDFTLLFEADEANYKRIQMQKEKVSVQLYKGFAVVKGMYWMKNNTSDTITINAGYPINALYGSYQRGSDLTEVIFDSLYQLQVYIDGEIVEFIKQEIPDTLKNIYSIKNDHSDWYTWKNSFKPNGLTKIEVYFIVNTNNSSIREGYDKAFHNAFIYVLETGATWKGDIEEGTIGIQLLDGLSIKNIHGLAANFDFQHAQTNNVIYGSFKNLRPTHEDNIVITYNEREESFDFEKVIIRSKDLFKTIDLFSSINYANLDAKPISFNSPFDIPNIGGTVIGAIFILGIYGIPILIGFIIIYIAYRLIKKYFS